MCGLVGLFTKNGNGFTDEQRTIFNTLMLVDTLRGEDSTGVFVVHNDGDLSLAKQATSAPDFLGNPDYKKLMTTAYMQGACAIGHNRKATKGSVTDENAHPFVVDDKIVLVHNGGIWGDHKKHANVDVDSHAIAHLLAEHHPEEALGKFMGAYALIWYDVEEEKVHLIRNKERPLWWMETHDAWIWSSEAPMLYFVANRYGLRLKEKPFQIEEEVLNTFALRNRRWELSCAKLNIKSPATSQWTQPSKAHPAACAYNQEWWDQMQKGKGPQDENWDADIPFKKGAAEAEERALAEKIRKGGHQQPSSILSRAMDITIGGDILTTSHFEQGLAWSCNKMITMGEFNREVVDSYRHQGEVRCRAFEYAEDGDGGFYLYASPVDDPHILFRHHFRKESKPEEARMLSMSVNEWVLALTVGKKGWMAFDPSSREGANQEGYVIIESTACRIVIGGGVKQVEVANA